MKLRSSAPGPLPPIPLSVLLTLLWVGLVRLFFLWVSAQAGAGRHGGAWAAGLFDQRVLGRARLPTILVAISLLLLLYLWLDYRSRPARPWRAAVFLLAAALLVYLSWAVWYSWWSHLQAPPLPGDMLMTALPVGGVLMSALPAGGAPAALRTGLPAGGAPGDALSAGGAPIGRPTVLTPLAARGRHAEVQVSR